MSSSGLFTPSGGVNSTTNVAVTTASQTFTLPTQTNLDDTLLLSNAGTAMVFWSFGNVTASQVTCQPLNPNATQLISLPPGATQISVIAWGTGSTLYATVGKGNLRGPR
jgi:hypothetical protein